MTNDSKADCLWLTLNILVGLEWPTTKRQSEESVPERSRSSIRSKSAKSDSSDNRTRSKSSSRTKSTSENEEVEDEFVVVLPKIDCSFSHPKVRSRLEKLMGSNLVRLTDRKYMQKLHSRILLDYVQSMNKRIAQREEMEREREKILVLTGKIPMEDAPPEMSGHPVLLINAYCEKLIAERRAKIKVPKVVIPLWLYVDDTPDPPPALSIADGHHALRPEGGMLCIPPNLHLMTTDQEDIANGYMFTQDEFVKRFVYESPQIKELGQAQTVEEMYNLADEIIGTLKTLDTGK